jgi:hypothetical protein
MASTATTATTVTTPYHRRLRRGLIAGTATIAVLALGACGGSDDAEPAAGGTSAATSAAPDGEAVESGGKLGDLVSKSLTEGKSAHVVMEMGSQGSGEGDILFDEANPGMRLTMTVAGQEMTMLMVDSVMYTTGAQFGGKWVKMDFGDVTSGLGGGLGTDPAQMLANIEEFNGSGEEVEDDHWRFSKDGTTTDMFFGDDGYLERIEVSGASAEPVTITYSDWGKDVDIEAPPAADVMDTGSIPGLPGSE